MIVRSSLAAAVVFAAAASVICACGLEVIGTFVPGASGDAGTSDGGAPPVGDGGGPGGEGLPLLDAGTSPDAASVLDAGPAPGFCAAQPAGWVYCNDFETGVIGFDSNRQRNQGGGIDLETTTGGNLALRVRVDDGTAARSVYVTTEPLTTLGVMAETGYDTTFVFSVRQSSLAYAVLGGPLLSTGPGVTAGVALGIAAFDDGVRLDLAGKGTFPSVYWPPGDVWHSAWIRHGKAPFGAPFVQVVVDGIVVALERVENEASFATLVLRLGGYFTSENEGTLEVLYDNVLVRTF